MSLHSNDFTWPYRARDYEKLDWVKNNQFIRKFIDICQLKDTDQVLDVGTGTGRVANAIAPFVEKVIGIDYAKEMLAKAKKDYGNIEYKMMDAMDLKFKENIFDLVTARMVFHHLPDLNRAVKELYRVLKHGGSLVLSEGVPPDKKTISRYKEIFKLKEKRTTFLESDLINLLHFNKFEEIVLKVFYMPQMSINNWLDNAGLNDSKKRKIIDLHLKADSHFKKVYNMKVKKSDILIDWKFVILKGIKKIEK